MKESTRTNIPPIQKIDLIFLNTLYLKNRDDIRNNIEWGGDRGPKRIMSDYIESEPYMMIGCYEIRRIRAPEIVKYMTDTDLESQ